MENHSLSVSSNVFLIDWLTIVTHCDTVLSVKRLLGLAGSDIPWESSCKFRNGYPLQESVHGITIYHGADNPVYYKEDTKARTDMGICITLTGKGCRYFEERGTGDWNYLFSQIFERGMSITRLDLAYDDHDGILDIHRIRYDIEDRNFISKSSKTYVNWSDDQQTDIQGLTCYVGSPSSEIRTRIYDKAAERGFKDRHWVRVELQLRKDRAYVAAYEIYKQQHIGRVVSGILSRYLTFRVPSADSNKSRWEITNYWQHLLFSMEQIKLWISPGEEYNFSKTDKWLFDQVGAAMFTALQIRSSLRAYTDPYLFGDKKLPKKYQDAIDTYRSMVYKSQEEEDNGCFECIPGTPEEIQLEMWKVFHSVE